MRRALPLILLTATVPPLGAEAVKLNLFDPDFTQVEFMEFTPTREPCKHKIDSSLIAGRRCALGQRTVPLLFRGSSSGCIPCQSVRRCQGAVHGRVGHAGFYGLLQVGDGGLRLLLRQGTQAAPIQIDS